MGLGIPPLKIKIKLESNPLKSKMLVRRLAVGEEEVALHAACASKPASVAFDLRCTQEKVA